MKTFTQLIKLVLISAIGFTHLSYGIECSISSITPGEKFSAVSGPLSFFISSNPQDPNEVGIILDEGNFIFQHNNPQNPTPIRDREFRVPGFVDPVFFPDAEFLIIPGFSIYPYSEFKEGDQLRSNVDAVASYTSETRRRTFYQSVGLVEETEDHKIYRIVDEANNSRRDQGANELYVQDYTFLKQGDALVFDSIGENYVLCEDELLKTPRISKTGKYLSAYDVTDRTTKIYRLRQEGQVCEEIIDFGIQTGKVDFNHDDSKVAFHVTYLSLDSLFNIQAGIWSANVSTSEENNAYIANLIKDDNDEIIGIDTMTRITKSAFNGEGGWYPSFSGEFINYRTKFFHPISQGATEGLVQVDLSKNQTDYTAFWYSTEGKSTEEIQAIASHHLLASLSLASCDSKPGTSNWNGRRLEQALSDVLLMSPATCRSLVEQTWQENRDIALNNEELNNLVGDRLPTGFLENLTLEDVLSSCPSFERNSHITQAQIDSQITLREKLNGGDEIRSLCVSCHSPQGFATTIDFQNYNSLSLIDFNLSIDTLNHEPLTGLFTGRERFRDNAALMPYFSQISPRTREAMLCAFKVARMEKYPIFSLQTIPSECALYVDDLPVKQYENTEVMDIPDEGDITSTLVIEEFDQLVDDTLVVSLDINHDSVSDIRVELISPSGTVVTLIDEVVVQPDTQRLRFIQQNFTTELSAFYGDPIAGQWTLRVFDTAKEDTGSLRSWSITQWLSR